MFFFCHDESSSIIMGPEGCLFWKQPLLKILPHFLRTKPVFGKFDTYTYFLPKVAEPFIFKAFPWQKLNPAVQPVTLTGLVFSYALSITCFPIVERIFFYSSVRIYY